MILVPVRDRKPFYLVDVILQISDIRDHKVDPQHIILRECQAAVHDHNAVLILDRGDVHTDLL